MAFGNIQAELIIPLIVALGGSSSVIMGALKKLSGKINNLSPKIKPVVLVLISYGVAKLSALVGAPLPSDPSQWTGDMINTILITVSGLGLHNLKKVYFPDSTTSTTPAPITK